MKLSDARTPTEILDVLTRRAWYKNHDGQKCPDHRIPTPADLLEWMEKIASYDSGAGKLEQLELQDILSLENFNLSISSLNQLWLDSLKTYTQEHPLIVLIEGWQKQPVEGRANLSRPDRILPANLATVPQNDRRSMKLFGPAMHVIKQGNQQLVFPGFGLERERSQPALPLMLYYLGGGPGKDRGHVAPLALRLWVESILAVDLTQPGGELSCRPGNILEKTSNPALPRPPQTPA